jgi:hypothetical protein
MHATVSGHEVCNFFLAGGNFLVERDSNVVLLGQQRQKVETRGLTDTPSPFLKASPRMLMVPCQKAWGQKRTRHSCASLQNTVLVKPRNTHLKTVCSNLPVCILCLLLELPLYNTCDTRSDKLLWSYLPASV